jgi:exportin-1
MFEHSTDPIKFKFTLRDFLISLKEFSGDNAELYIDEKEAETERKQQEEREMAMRVPGMLKPAQLDDDADL